MTLRVQRLGRVFGWGICALGAGCTTAGGGTDSGGDPLARFQLGRDEAFDGMIRAITEADNRIVDCLALEESPESFTDQETLDALKAGFGSIDSPAGNFDQFVATIATNEPTKANDICDLEPGEDAALDAEVARLTAARNRLAGCTGGQTVDDAESLADLERAYFFTVEAAPPLAGFADVLADTVEAEADAACAG